MPQLDYIDQRTLPAFEGGLADAMSEVVSRSPGGNVKQLNTLTIGTPTISVAAVKKLTITTAADADAYTIQIGDYVFTGTSAGTDKTVQRDAIKAQLDADADFLAQYTVATSSTDALTITARRVGVDVSVPATVVIAATSVWDWTEVTANVIGTQFNLTIDGRTLSYQAASTTIADERDALLALLQADTFFAARVVFAAVSTNAISVTALTAGIPFTTSYTNENAIGQAGAGTVTYAATTANVTGSPIPFGRAVVRTSSAGVAVLPSATGFSLEGVSINRAKARPRDNTVSPPITGPAQYLGDEAVPVLRKGRVYVIPETTGALTASVYVRHTLGTDAAHTVGRFRATDDSGKVDAVTAGARWITVPTAGVLTILEINLPQ